MIKRRARHRHVYVVEFYRGKSKLGMPKSVFISKNAFLGEKDAREHGHKVLERDTSGTTFMVHKLPLHSERK